MGDTCPDLPPRTARLVPGLLSAGDRTTKDASQQRKPPGGGWNGSDIQGLRFPSDLLWQSTLMADA